MNSKNKKAEKKRFRHLFYGTVQGVGFRPFLYRIAVKNGLNGFVQNTPFGAVAEVEGSPAALKAFLLGVEKELPPLAHVSRVESSEIALRNDSAFAILSSTDEGQADVHITPDAATCADCLAELFEAGDRRYRYPFINCTNCGPRLTIINAIPYDRANTSMSCFKLCEQCQAEYENPADRRFHAEANACPVCGPHLNLLDTEGKPVESEDPVKSAVHLLLSGKILAIKGLGGFHLSVDAANDEALKKLRARKYREEKPLAIMVRDIAQAKRIAEISREEEILLMSPQRPIVLLRKIKNNLISDLVAPGVPNLGIMLPYTPLHHLLLENNFAALVMTSANQVDEPICIGNREALQRLGGIADYFLVHNRDIVVRCDDSIAFTVDEKSRLLRRARGFVPQPLQLNDSYRSASPVLALGGQLKCTQCILKGKFVFVSPHIGDLETPQARDFFHENIALMKRITESDPKIIACDYHPSYYSTQAARKIPAEKIIKVQHHHAHIVSCMAENQIEGKVIGLAMDGSGYGMDANAWGGEFLIADETGFERFAHWRYMVLPGGEKAIREPWRIAISLLKAAYGGGWKEKALQFDLVEKSQIDLFDIIIDDKINSPLSSGLGRLFDGVAALIGLRKQVSFEGQAAMALEALATGCSDKPYPVDIIRDTQPFIVDMNTVVKAIVKDMEAGAPRANIAASFHRTVIEASVLMAEEIRRATGLDRVVLSGGCFQNKILLEGTIDKLRHSGFDVYTHSQVPTNDGGVSLGQAVVAASMVQKGLA